MRLIQLVVRFSIKILANTLKLLSYFFHAVCPRVRFTLPAYSRALFCSTTGSEIPRTIWQTNYTNRVTLPVYLNYLFNRLMAPSFAYRFMTTEEREHFVRNNYDGETYQSYLRLQIGAAQADFWRVLVLQKYGGVYMDIDAHLVWPLAPMLPSWSKELFIQIKTGEISNYFIASKPNNAHLELVIRQIELNIKTSKSDNVYYITGPGVFSELLLPLKVPTRSYLSTCNQGNFTNEYFQYLDKPQGKWNKEQKVVPVIRKDS